MLKLMSAISVSSINLQKWVMNFLIETRKLPPTTKAHFIFIIGIVCFLHPTLAAYGTGEPTE